MITKVDNRFLLNCPECNAPRFYKWHYMAVMAKNKRSVCKVCAHKGTKNYLFGKSLSTDIIEKISNSKKGKSLSTFHKNQISISQKRRYLNPEESRLTSEQVRIAMHKPDIRKKHIEALSKTKWLKVKTDNGQLEMIEKWNRLGFKFEPNYRFKTDQDLFYIDGYDSVHNIVLEYDGKYHKSIGQQQKDLIRQQKIIDILHPKKFWRYDSVNKTIINILGD